MKVLKSRTYNQHIVQPPYQIVFYYTVLSLYNPSNLQFPYGIVPLL